MFVKISNKPCLNCEALENEHVDNKCLFGPTFYRTYEDEELATTIDSAITCWAAGDHPAYLHMSYARMPTYSYPNIRGEIQGPYDLSVVCLGYDKQNNGVGHHNLHLSMKLFREND